MDRLNRTAKLTIAGGLAVLAVAWFFRYSVTPLDQFKYTKLDRWTGKVIVCGYLSPC